MTVIICSHTLGSTHGTLGDRNGVGSIFDFGGGDRADTRIYGDIDSLGSSCECDRGNEDGHGRKVLTGHDLTDREVLKGGTFEGLIPTRGLIHVTNHIICRVENTQITVAAGKR
jgi:hypothetical protein